MDIFLCRANDYLKRIALEIFEIRLPGNLYHDGIIFYGHDIDLPPAPTNLSHRSPATKTQEQDFLRPWPPWYGTQQFPPQAIDIRPGLKKITGHYSVIRKKLFYNYFAMIGGEKLFPGIYFI
jgi:hypothetical protein